MTKTGPCADNVVMNSKKIWFGTGAFALILLFCILFSPALFAQGRSPEEEAAARYMQVLQYTYNFLQKNYVDEIDPAVLYEGAMKGMLDAVGDPYTTYIDAKSILGLNLKDTTTGSFGGVGLSITKELVSTPEAPAWVEVASPIEDTPGWKAGVQPGDLILEIDGVKTPDITMEEVLSRLRGPVGTPVTVLLRRGRSMEFPVTLTRALIEVPTVKFAMMPNGIGYLRIIEFTPLTASRVQDALNLFEQSGYTSLLIDLRNNPGGLITSVVDVADKFIDSGVIVSTRSRITTENREFTARASRTTFRKNIPIVILINRGSASASEILAGALKDYGLAYLIGENTYGKGSVQQVIDLIYEDALKLTIARYYTPSGANIDKAGIPPDREVLFPELTEAEEKALEALLNTTVLADFVSGKTALSGAEADAFAKTLALKYPVSERILKRMVMQEFYRTHISPLYDMEFDVQLKAAYDLLREGRVTALTAATKTVLALQQEKKAAEDALAASQAASSQPAP